MVNYINLWAKGIVVAVIVGTIIEMILPEGNNKKYIKTVIGIYILFVIIYPIVTSLTRKTININKIIETTYGKTSLSYNENNNIQLDTNKYVEDIYSKNIKEEITERLFNKNYKVENIELVIETENEENYGKINNIKITISKIITERNNNITNISEVQKININTKNKDVDTKNIDNQISKEEIEELKNYLVDTYLISIDKIQIN